MAIEILTNKMILWGSIYPLSVLGLEVLQTHIEENLKKGYIHPSKSPSGVPIFFVKNKSGKLGPVINYKDLMR